MAAIVDPHDKMRARDVNKVGRGEQAPRPPQQTPNVSPPPEQAESRGSKKENSSNQMQRCFDSYHQYHTCMKEKGKEAHECKKVAEYYKTTCPDWIGLWSIE